MIALFLDVDGVLNQYLISERKRRYKIHKRNTYSKETDVFNPFQKKVLRLAKLVKKYKIDVYVFSAWTIEDIQPHLPFKLKGDVRKRAERVANIMNKYDKCILIDDELSGDIFGIERVPIPKEIITYQPDWKYGLVLRDFKKIEKIIEELV